MSLQDILDRVSQAVGIVDFATDVLPTLTPEIGAAIAQAEMDPTSANVQHVFWLYAQNGVVPPAKLAAHLLYINEREHPEDTIRGNLTPWLIGGGIVLYLLLKRR